jgi:hypothetical protein
VTPTLRREDNINMALKEMGYEDVHWAELAYVSV